MADRPKTYPPLLFTTPHALRGKGVSNVLSIGIDTSGGFLVPEEYSNVLIQALEEQNIFRRISRIVSTFREKLKIPIATASGTILGRRK